MIDDMLTEIMMETLVEEITEMIMTGCSITPEKEPEVSELARTIVYVVLDCMDNLKDVIDDEERIVINEED